MCRASPPAVLKYDGLAAGKGVVIARTMEEAEAALKKYVARRQIRRRKGRR